MSIDHPIIPDDHAPNRRYSIGEVSDLLKIPQHLLRQWEERFSQLRPKRTRTNRRYYLREDIDIILRIKTLLHSEHMKVKGARKRLTYEIVTEGKPSYRLEHRELLDRVAAEAQAILAALGPDTDAASAVAPPEPENIERFQPRGSPFRR